MAVVDFAQIEKVSTSQATGLDPDAMEATPYDMITDVGDRTNLYDIDYGYFIFGQSIGFTYDETKTYRSQATFTIQGAFTINAEAMEHQSTLNDTDAFNLVTQKYKDLEAMFDAAGNAPPPVLYKDWGTQLDLRCLPLPDPLWDKDGNVIYAIPESLEIQPGTWGRTIKYTATFKEPIFPKAKVMLGNVVVDRGTINITVPRPILYRHRLVGCVGEVVQCRNYSVLEAEVSGQIGVRQDSTEMLTTNAKALAQQLEFGRISIGIVRKTATGQEVETLFLDMDVDKGTGLEIQPQALMNAVSVKTKARI